MKETLKISDRFNLVKKLGQGTFSYIYEAYDKVLEQNVALKIEKKDKNKSILMFEYNVLKLLKGINQVCNVYDFVKNSEQNLIVMDLLGNNLAKVRKCLEQNYSAKIAIQLLIEMLDAIEKVNDRGFIHRDVKASNFVLSKDSKQLFIVDFGLAKKHLDDKGNPVPARKKADFRGTVSFASLNAHNNIDLSRRDDLWSLYFVILDFLNEKLKWREQKDYTMDQVKKIKTQCFNNPEDKLWTATKNIPEVKQIFYHLKSLSYNDKPNYQLIRGQLTSILGRHQEVCQSLNPIQATTQIYGNGPFIIQQQQAMNNYLNNQNAEELKIIQQIGDFQASQQPIHCTQAQNEVLQKIQDMQQYASIVNGQTIPGIYQKQVFAIQQNLHFNQPQHMQPQDLQPQFTEAVKPAIPTNVITINTQPQQPTKRVGIKRKTIFSQVLEQAVRATDSQVAVVENVDAVLKSGGKTKQTKLSQTTKKRETKKKGKCTEQAPIEEVPLQQEPPIQKFEIIAPQNKMIIQSKAQADQNYLNQISICQNFYLNPQFLFLLNEQNENQLYQANSGIQQQISQQYSGATTVGSTRPNIALSQSISHQPSSFIDSQYVPGGTRINLQQAINYNNNVGGLNRIIQNGYAANDFKEGGDIIQVQNRIIPSSQPIQECKLASNRTKKQTPCCSQPAYKQDQDKIKQSKKPIFMITRTASLRIAQQKTASTIKAKKI